MSSAEHVAQLSPPARQLLFALMELGHLDDAALDRLASELEGLPVPVDAAALRRVVAGMLFEHPPADADQAKLLGLEWGLLFG